MDFMEFIKKSSPEDLQKIAEQAQDEIVAKVMSAMIPLLEKQAEYTLELIKKAMEEGEAQEPQEEEKEEPKKEEIEEMPIEPGTIPGTTYGEDNSDVVGSETPGGIVATDVQVAVNQAIEAGQATKIEAFVKAVASSHPEALFEIIKIVKVVLHTAIMKRKIDPAEAAKVAQALDGLAAGPSEEAGEQQ